MAKITVRLINKMLSSKLNSKEINHVVTAVMFQDKSGLVEGGLDRTVMSSDGSMSERQHYNIIKSLEGKNIYEISGRNLRIIDNNFIDENGNDDYKNNNYIELPNFIHDKKFLNSPVLVKRLILRLLVNRILSQPVKLELKTFIKWLDLNRKSKFLDVSRLLCDFDFFIVDQNWENGICKLIVKLKREFTGTSRIKTARNSENKVRNMLKKKKLFKHINPVALRDFIQLFNEYKQVFVECLQCLNIKTLDGSIFRNIIRRSLANI